MFFPYSRAVVVELAEWMTTLKLLKLFDLDAAFAPGLLRVTGFRRELKCFA